MHMLEMHGGPEHLVVFITSDQDFCEKIQELQRRNFKVAVLYHGPHASSKAASITQVADESHDWLTFLKEELGLQHLSVAPYDPQAYHGAKQAQNAETSAQTTAILSRQSSQESRHTARVTRVSLPGLPHLVCCVCLDIDDSCDCLTCLAVNLPTQQQCSGGYSFRDCKLTYGSKGLALTAEKAAQQTRQPANRFTMSACINRYADTTCI